MYSGGGAGPGTPLPRSVRTLGFAARVIDNWQALCVPLLVTLLADNHTLPDVFLLLQSDVWIVERCCRPLRFAVRNIDV